MLRELVADLDYYANSEKAAFFPRFFKTEAGQYGEGDKFLGITVPECRSIARKFKHLPRDDIQTLLMSPWHEQRLVALLILLLQYKKASEMEQRSIYAFYLKNTPHINNWDLVDLSCRDIVGAYIYNHPEESITLTKLATSDLLWDRRISIISTFYFLMQGDPKPTLTIAEKLLPDKHDLIQKATGWMLRELGKRIDEVLLITFLKRHYRDIPRTTLRYAIERFPATTRKQILSGKFPE
ncbi:MAG TPA: DNA alkylation repair protein [Candidatus Saccharimonadales bacterium]|nr:DNA alkylation repair protein [Candidatus Saccharimonadales bacterium]